MKTKQKSSGNRLKAYFSKPANVISVIFFIILIAAVVLPLFTLLISSVTINGSQEAMYVGGGAKNGYLNRLTGEATGKQVIALPIEATALGNLKIQLEADV